MGEKWKQWQILFSQVPKSLDSNCSQYIKRCLLPERTAMTKLDSILKSRDITLLTKVSIVKAMVFPVVMYGCENCTIKKAAPWRINAFEFGAGEDPWESLYSKGGIKPVTPKENPEYSLKGLMLKVNPEYSLEGLMLKLKLHYFGHLMWRPTHWKGPWCRENWGQEEKGATEVEMVGWHDWLNGYELEQAPGNSKGLGSLECCSSWGRKELDTT